MNTNSTHRKNFDEEINLIDLFSILWSNKITITLFIILSSSVAVISSLYMPDVYRSEASLAPVSLDGSGGSNNPLGQLGGLAGIAGISLNSKNVDKTTLGINVLRSRKFFNEMSEKYNLLVPLMASKGWDRESNSLRYNPNIYDIKNKKWVKNDYVPSSQEAHKKFNEQFKVSQDESGLIVISMEHHSPNIAKNWLDWIILEINNSSRNEDINQANRSINYLNDQLALTQFVEIKESLNDLVKSQVETIMLAQVRPEYLFKVIDPPFTPEEKFKPSRAIICIIAFLLGGVIGTTFVLIKNFILNQKSKN